MSNIYSSILEKLAALNIDIFHYEDIVRCYALAKLNIEHSQKPDYTDGIHTAAFASEASRYQLLPSDESPYYDSPAIFSFCSTLVSAGMDKDCRLFFEACAPFLVVDWDTLVSKFPKGHYEKLAYVLYLILRSTKASQLPVAEIDKSTTESFYEENKELYNSFEISKETFTECWKAVYHISMPALQGTVSSNLVDTIRFYRHHKVSGLRLLANYCQFNMYRTQMGDPINPWLEFQYAVKGKQNIESQLGKSIDDYPIVCNNDRWDVRCSARELTNAARILFQSIKIKASQMASISEDLQNEPISQKDSLPFEDRKDPTAYLFRRNFGTHLHILGLSEPEIEYVIGHDIDDPYETRNEFVNEEKLFAIKQKMDRRPLVNSDFAQTERIDVGERLQLQHTACVQIPVDSAETEMHITANEPTDNIRVSLSVRPQSMRVQLNCRRYKVRETEYDRFVDTQQQYHKVYTKA